MQRRLPKALQLTSDVLYICHSHHSYLTNLHSSSRNQTFSLLAKRNCKLRYLPRSLTPLSTAHRQTMMTEAMQRTMPTSTSYRTRSDLDSAIALHLLHSDRLHLLFSRSAYMHRALDVRTLRKLWANDSVYRWRARACSRGTCRVMVRLCHSFL